MKADPMKLMRDMTDGYFIINLQINYMRKHPEVFEQFLQPYERFATTLGLSKHQNTVRSLMLDVDNEVIDNLNDLCHERFVEWRIVPGHKFDSKAEKLAKQATDEYFNSAPYK